MPSNGTTKVRARSRLFTPFVGALIAFWEAISGADSAVRVGAYIESVAGRRGTRQKAP